MGSKTTPRFTKREKLAVLTEAIRLIRKPATWCEGKWRCAVNLRNDDGAVQYDANGDIVKVHAYCAEGALNQAAITVLGLDRAIKLGAIRAGTKEEDLSWYDSAFENTVLGGLISLDSEALKAFPEAFARFEDGEELPGTEGSIMTVNDDFGHEATLKLMKRKQRKLRKEIKAEDEAKALVTA